jgi:hypothetical protein
MVSRSRVAADCEVYAELVVTPDQVEPETLFVKSNMLISRSQSGAARRHRTDFPETVSQILIHEQVLN